MRAPRLARALLERTLPPGDRGRTILGDLLEAVAERPDRFSTRLWIWRETLSLAARYGIRRLRAHRPGRRPGQENRRMWIDAFRSDSRFALRSWRKAPGFTAVVLATLTLGIGASTAIFSFVDGVLLRPLPYPEPERLVHVNEVDASGDGMSVSWPDFLDWRAHQRSFSNLVLSRREAFTWTGGEVARRVAARRISAGFFAALGIRPELGVDFGPADELPGGEAKVILGHAFWRDQLSADPAAIGRSLLLNGRAHVVVGVLPADFRFLGRDYDLYVPMGPIADSKYLLMRANHQGYVGFGRLAPGATLASAGAELGNLAAGIARSYPGTNTGVTTKVTPLAEQLVSQVRPTLLALLGAVGLLLLLACTNVASLLVARGAARQRELAVRSALGGGRARIVAQLLVESCWLALGGAALGVIAGAGLLRALVAVAPAVTPRLDEVRLDGAAVLVALGSAALCGLVFGAFPALQAAVLRSRPSLLRARAGGATAEIHRLRRGLLAAEVALALVLLAGAGLTARTLQGLASVDAGFAPDHLLTLRVSLPATRFADDAALDAFHRQALARLGAIPGIRAAALADSLPIEGTNWTSVFYARDRPEPARGEFPSAAFLPVSDGYFATLGMRTARGRLFTATDTASSPPVVVVNETLAAKLWPGEDPVGRFLKQGWPESPTPWREVVGVVADVKFEGIAEPTSLQIYLPMPQNPSDSPAIVVRTAGPPAGARAAIEAAMRELDRDLPLYAVRTMDEMLADSIARQRMSMLVLLVFAAVALTLAAVGLYGVVAQGVTERTHEIGVRMALGAERHHVLRLVLRQGLATALVGTAIGLAGALVLSRTIRGLLFGVTPTDPWTFVAVVATLLAVTAAACYIPARRAARVDPTLALRAE